MPILTPITLDTGRLTLRWIGAGDAEAQFAIFSDPEVMRYWSSAPWTELEQAHANIAQARANYEAGSALRLAVVLKATGQLIGNVNLYAFFDQNRRCDIGYALARPWWGSGYLGEALAAALEYGFAVLDLNRIEADIDPRNGASIKLLERLGFQKEGYMRERWIVNGEVCDTVNYGLLKRDWHRTAGRA